MQSGPASGRSRSSGPPSTRLGARGPRKVTMIHPAGAGDRADKPGSDGEHQLQQAWGTEARADRFYDEQVCDRLLPAMAEFVERMPMLFVATADAHGECDSSLRAG